MWRRETELRSGVIKRLGAFMEAAWVAAIYCGQFVAVDILAKTSISPLYGSHFTAASQRWRHISFLTRPPSSTLTTGLPSFFFILNSQIAAIYTFCHSRFGSSVTISELLLFLSYSLNTRFLSTDNL